MYYNKEMECMPREQLSKLQGERLAAQIRRVYENVEPYRKKMDEAGVKPEDIRTIEDIVKLPFTLKTDLRAAYPFGMVAVPKKQLVRLHASSGTTGKLTVVSYTQHDLDDWAEAVARSLYCAGINEDSIINVAYGYGLFTGGLGIHYGSERIGALTVPISTGQTSRQIMLLKDFGADVLCCTPSYAQYIGEEVAKSNLALSDLHLKKLILGAEPWTEEMRQGIEKQLNVKAYNIYGLSEISGPGVSMECDLQDGCHIWEDMFYPEIIDPKTLQPVAEGEVGELVFTTLTKEGMPLIRYRTRDLCSLNYAPCACGRTMVRMNRILGRTDDMLIIRGVNVFPSQIETVLLSCGEGVLPFYQIVVDRVNSLDTFEILVEVTDSILSDEVKQIESLRRKLREQMLANLSISPVITFVSPGTIPRFEGKAVRVVDKRDAGIKNSAK